MLVGRPVLRLLMLVAVVIVRVASRYAVVLAHRPGDADARNEHRHQREPQHIRSSKRFLPEKATPWGANRFQGPLIGQPIAENHVLKQSPFETSILRQLQAPFPTISDVPISISDGHNPKVVLNGC